jgi:hypothetical protein
MVTRVVPDGKKKVLIPTNTNNCKILATDFHGFTRDSASNLTTNLRGPDFYSGFLLADPC